MALRDAMTDGMMKTVNLVHRNLLSLSRGRFGHTAGSMPVVELRTIGRTSGRTRSVMLTTPIREQGTFVLVASKGGDDRHPDWYRNLVANPEVELVVDGTTVPLHARTASDSERAELWPRIIDAYDGYEGYQKKTERVIPIVICEPRSLDD